MEKLTDKKPWKYLPTILKSEAHLTFFHISIIKARRNNKNMSTLLRHYNNNNNSLLGINTNVYSDHYHINNNYNYMWASEYVPPFFMCFIDDIRES